mgnify:CR=1 FL=1
MVVMLISDQTQRSHTPGGAGASNGSGSAGSVGSGGSSGSAGTSGVNGSSGGYLNITVNGTTQVYDTSSSNSGSVTVSIGDTVNVYAYASSTSGVYVYGNLIIDTTNYSSTQLTSVLITQTFTVTGNHTVTTNMYDGA